ncbi:MAG: hypothetical protein EZS28_040343 [Streblomastix strix]|uniref:Uncharacterized protein n=1 Tax=Streblomastix strix TaxID=222440 RepID=A0A5J4U2A4_9EUKA|nr:MAG: hypothetical protein EZS28_040343 [Streblomastix strix]
MIALKELILKELREEIIEEVQKKDRRWIIHCFAISKNGNGQCRKIKDCSILIKFLLSSRFIMEDVITLRQTLQPNDWMIKVDLKNQCALAQNTHRWSSTRLYVLLSNQSERRLGQDAMLTAKI